MIRSTRQLLTVAVAVSCLAAFAQPASAAFEISSFDGGVLQQDGEPATQAGSHPHTAGTVFSITLVNEPDFGVYPTGDTKDVRVDLPAGLVANPQAVATCPASEIFKVGNNNCPREAQVGVVRLENYLGLPTPDRVARPLYNLEAAPGTAAAIGFGYQGTVIRLVGKVRTGGDYGVTVDGLNSPQIFPIGKVDVTVWGTPADAHWDPWRNNCMEPRGELSGRMCPVKNDFPVIPFMTLPTSCVGPVDTNIFINTWQGEEDSAFFTSHDNVKPVPNPIGADGCGSVPFDPEIDSGPDTTRASSPAGLGFDLEVPQDGLLVPDGMGSAHLKKAVVKLPEGVTVNPAAADGLGACSPAQIGLTTPDPAVCPDSAKVAKVTIDTPLLDHQVEGDVFLAEQSSYENSLVALYIAAHDRETGVVLKLAGKVDLDPSTGRLTATFDNQPQLPFSKLHLEFKSGPRAALTTPRACGDYAIEAEFSSWAGNAPVDVGDAFTIDRRADGSSCGPDGFSPGFTAGTDRPVAGGQGNFSMAIARDDVDRELRAITSVKLPKGLLGKVASVPLCPEAQAAAGTCADESRIGRVQAAAGSGSQPLWIPQAGKAPTGVYLTGPYRGAPYGLSIEVPAQAGPFDLGRVVVRSALHVDRRTAQITTGVDEARVYDTDGTLTQVLEGELPRILKGFVLDVREVRVNVDRPGFVLNPTSCESKTIEGDVHPDTGAAAHVSVPFRVSNCRALPFSPRLALRLTGRKQVKTGRHPGVRAQVNQRGIGESGIERAEVRLPKSLALDPDNAQALCEFEDGTKPDLENHCPKGSIVGRARAKTPLLRNELAGNVYFVKNVRRDPQTGNAIRTLPMIVVALRGEIAINLRGESSTTKSGNLVNTFADVPDAPISRFNLNINGGANGILTVTQTRAGRINLCAKPRSHVAGTDFDGHNGKRFDRDVAMKSPCTKRQVKRATRAAKARKARG